jgi:hypothetical protein
MQGGGAVRVEEDFATGESAGDAAEAAMYARISSTRGELGPILRFAGGPEAEWPYGLFRTLRFALLPMFNTPEANTLRLVCKELKREVGEYPWEDMETVIRGYVGERVGEREGQRGAWRACFPRARGANVEMCEPWLSSGRRNPVVDLDFVHFVGLRALNMSCCSQVTGAALRAHLGGIEKLDISWCQDPTIANFAFSLLAEGGISCLATLGCSLGPVIRGPIAAWREAHPSALVANVQGRNDLTDADFAHFRGIKALNMSHPNPGYPGNNPSTITDAAFEHLAGIHTLDMSGHTGNQGITRAALSHLKGIRTLVALHCEQLGTLTGEDLPGIQTLRSYSAVKLCPECSCPIIWTGDGSMDVRCCQCGTMFFMCCMVKQKEIQRCSPMHGYYECPLGWKADIAAPPQKRLMKEAGLDLRRRGGDFS